MLHGVGSTSQHNILFGSGDYLVLVMAGIPLDMAEFKPAAFIGVLMGGTELFLGFWLVIKGFSPVEPATSRSL
jgi:hypothetical protein